MSWVWGAAALTDVGWGGGGEGGGGGLTDVGEGDDASARRGAEAGDELLAVAPGAPDRERVPCGLREDTALKGGDAGVEEALACHGGCHRARSPSVE